MNVEQYERPDPDLERDAQAFRGVSRILVRAERVIFAVIGMLLFLAAIALAWRSTSTLMGLFVGPSTSLIDDAAQFLDIVLLILMIAELAYTVTLSVKVGVLSPEPFLIVGLIAVIRRILVITVEQVSPQARGATGLANTSVEVALLTLVVIAFVFAVYLLRRSHR